MYYTLRQKHHWPHTANNIISVARESHSCPKTTGTVRKHCKYLMMFPAAELLELVAIDLPGPSTRTERGHQLMLVATDHFSRLTCFVPIRTTTATVVSNAFLNHCMYAYGAPA